MAKGKTKKTNKTKEMGRIYHKKTEVDGIVFDSQTEAEYYEYLKNEMNMKRIRKFEMQKELLRLLDIILNISLYPHKPYSRVLQLCQI